MADPYLPFEPSADQQAAQTQREEEELDRQLLLKAAIERFNEAQERETQASLEADHHATEVQIAARELQAALIDAAVGWLETKWGPQRACPYCGNQGWAIGTPFNVALQSGESLSPHFSVMCDNCGNTVFINAIVAGILPEPGEQ